MVLLYKFCELLVYPLGLSIICGLIGFILLVIRKKGAALLLYACSFGILLFFSVPVVGNFLLYQLESQYPAKESYPSASAIVLLGGAGVPDLPPRIYPELNEAADRLVNAVRLYKKGYAPRIILTGGKTITLLQDHMREADNNAYFLKEFFGMDNSALILERESVNTYEDCLFTERIFKQNQWKKRILLVTSAYHMPRAVMIFKKLGFEVYPAPADFNSYAASYTGIYDFFPSANALENSTTAIHEWYGMIGSKLWGWL